MEFKYQISWIIVSKSKSRSQQMHDWKTAFERNFQIDFHWINTPLMAKLYESRIIIYNRNKKQRINKESIMARKKKNSTNTTQATRPIKIAFHYYGIYFENSTLHIPQRIWWWRGSLNCLFNSFSCLCVCFVCVFFLLVFVSSVFFFFWHPIGYTILEFESMKRKKINWLK